MITIDKFDISYRNYGVFVIIYNLRTKEIFKFEDVAADIVTIIVNTSEIDIDVIVSGVLEIYECKKEDVVDDIQDFVNELFKNGIIMIDGLYCRQSSDNSNKKIITDDFEGRIISQICELGKLYSVTFEMTYSCNEQCIHCYANYPTDSDAEIAAITVEKYKALIDELYEMNCMHIAFTGGDPFMYKGFEDVFTYARQKGFVCDIYTNGLYLASNVDVMNRIIQLRPRTFYISLYGSDAKTHDTVTAIPGSFEKTVKSIRALTDTDISVVLNIMMLNVNYDKFDNIIAFAQQLKVEYRVGMSLIYKNNGDASPMQFFINDKNKIKTILNKNLNNVYSLDVAVGQERYSERMCGAGTTTLSISPDGKIYPCISLKLCLGNIANDKLEDIWNSEQRKNLKNVLSWKNAHKCNVCNLKKYCTHCPGISLAENNSLYACNTCDQMIAKCIEELKEDKI